MTPTTPTIILGFPAIRDGVPIGPATLLCGPEIATGAQYAFVQDCEERDAIPGGLRHLALYTLAPQVRITVSKP